ncbi:hypothetical protein INS49_007223 [Diaporthe citri]|uniref:uncharacterized protein n=1 Tax=Diaporthe citri TaxID=83186 RepID=UPI001C7F7893|nr:uncharacterized protein INS49_007223 [Diaporthe citri]KAG6365612.1 hypothetical protein INS49_007223 [Diaporthe citri]
MPPKPGRQTRKDQEGQDSGHSDTVTDSGSEPGYCQFQTKKAPPSSTFEAPSGCSANVVGLEERVERATHAAMNDINGGPGGWDSWPDADEMQWKGTGSSSHPEPLPSPPSTTSTTKRHYVDTPTHINTGSESRTRHAGRLHAIPAEDVNYLESQGRVKLLYDMETEDSQLSLAQAALLLTCWVPGSKAAFQLKPNSTWLSLAIQHARSINADRCTTSTPTTSTAGTTTCSQPQKLQNMLRRLWWSCIIRDRLGSLCTRRSISITRHRFGFDAVTPLGFADLEDEVHRSSVYNAATKRSLARLLTHYIQFCIVLTDVLTLVFLFENAQQSRITPKPEDEAGIEECKVLLESSARIALYHYSVLYHSMTLNKAAEPSRHKTFEIIHESRQELQDAALSVTECLGELVRRHLAHWLPITAVACVATPLALHSITAKLASARGANTGTTTGGGAAERQGTPAWGGPAAASSSSTTNQKRMAVFAEAMKAFLPRYEGTEWVAETVRHVSSLAQSLMTESAGSSFAADWTDLLARHTSSYLLMTMTVDVCIGQGRPPEERHFPAWLRGGGGDGGSSGTGPPMRALSPTMTTATVVGQAAMMEGPVQGLNLGGTGVLGGMYDSFSFQQRPETDNMQRQLFGGAAA